MTPDLKRLRDAADKAMCSIGHSPHGLMDHESEAIVRAVLMELLEGDDDEDMTNRIDRILAEPAKA